MILFWGVWVHTVFFQHFYKGNNFHDLVFCFPAHSPSELGSTLSLSHSEWSNRSDRDRVKYGVLTILCAIGLKERICFRIDHR